MSTQNETPSSQFLEKLLIAIFVILGGVGYCCIVNEMSYTPEELAHHGNSIYRDDSHVHNLVTRGKTTITIGKQEASAKKINRSKEEFLAVKGDMEANSPVYFEIPDFTPSITYYLDFGDGIIRELTQKSNVHIYEKPGNYKVKLSLRYEGEEAIVNNSSITIHPEIMVSMNARDIDF